MTAVLWIVPAYPWQDDPVAGLFFRTQAQALARQGMRVTIVSPTPWAPWPLSRIQGKWRRYATVPETAVDGALAILRPRFVNVPGEPRWAQPDRLVADAVWRTRGAWPRPDVVHGHSAMTGLAAWRVARRAGSPLVLTFHGGDLNVWPDRHRDRLADLSAAAADASAVLAVSDALSQRAKAITGVDAVTLPLGSDHRALANSARPRRDARAALGLPDDRFIVLFVGNLLAAKGVRELADAIIAGSDRSLGVFLGEGPERGYGADRPEARGRLDYRGARTHDEVSLHMSAADVLVLPSHTEGLPSVLVEAGSLGLPVIASAVGGIPTLLGADRGTLLPEVSVDAIVQALAEVEREPAPAAAAAARLRTFVREVHDVDLNAARLGELYRRSMEAATLRGSDAQGG